GNSYKTYHLINSHSQNMAKYHPLSTLNSNVKAPHMLLRAVFFLILLSALTTGCSPKRADFEPKVVYVPVERDFTRTPSAFPPLTDEELEEPWGSELHAGRCFAKEL